MSNFVVVSFATADTPYEGEIEKLIKSAKKFDIPIHVEILSNRRSWQKNTQLKGPFLSRMLYKKDKNIVWMDADAIFHSYPILFDEIKADIGVHYRTWKHARNELLTGTIFIKNNERMRKIIDEWIIECKRNSHHSSQRPFQKIIRRNEHLLKIERLPIEYCCIFDDDKRHKISPVIEHFQASRRFRRTVAK